MRYFDHNATHPLTRAAREAWIEATERYIGNPSSPHRVGDRADRALNQAREKLAGWLGCGADEIIFTSGATESNNTALAHLAATRPGELLVSAIEHPSILETARVLFANRHRTIPVSCDGVIDFAWLREQLDPAQVAGVAVMAANNETGVLQPWKEVAALCRERGVPYLCDAAQWVGKLPAAGLGACDLVSGCAHKFGGPLGVGFLKCRGELRPLLHGGPQEDRRRAGTENVPGVLAMIAALTEAEASTGDVSLRDRFIAKLEAAIPGARVLGANAPRLWNTVAVLMPEARDCRQRWVVKLDKLGVAVSTGSACASGKEKPSHVLTAMGIRPDEAGRALRFSSGWKTTPEDWTALLDALRAAVDELAPAEANGC